MTGSLINKSDPPFFRDPARIFLAICVVLGLVLCVFIPMGTGFDEDQHLVRIYDIAGLDFLPNRDEDGKTATLYEFSSLSYRRAYFQNQGSDWLFKEKWSIKPDLQNMYYVSTRAVYPPIIYLLQAIFARYYWMKFSLPIIPGVILLRMIGLFIYAIITFIAVKILPIGKWVLFVLALSPTAIFQAATVNADGYNNAISFIFLSYVTNHIIKIERFNNRQVFILFFLTLLTGFSKPGTVILVLYLFALNKNKFKTRSQILLIWLGAITSVILTVVWWKISMASNAPSDLLGVNISQNMHYIILHPWEYFLFFIQTTFYTLKPYLLSWIAAYGYWIGTVPNIVYWLFPAALIISLLLENREYVFTKKKRFFFLIFSIVTITSVLLQYNLVKYEPGLAATELSAHGRYFIPFSLSFFIALSGLICIKGQTQKWMTLIIIFSTIFALVFFTIGLVTTYYAECRENIFKPNECTLPHYQNIDTSTPPYIFVNNQISIKQQFTNTCKNLASIELLIGQTPTNTKDIFWFSIINNQNEEIFAKAIPAEDLSPFTRIKFGVSGSNFIKGDSYWMVISSPISVEGLGLAVRPIDVYPGQLLLNNKENHSDLIFYYTCSK